MAASRKTTRREFLKGQSTVDALQELAQGRTNLDENQLADPSDIVKTPGRTLLLDIQRRAMACNFAVNLNAGQYPSGPEAAVQALDLVETLEDQLTAFRDHSEICRINRNAGNGPVVVEARLHQLLVDAVRLSQETNGAFDITAGPLSKVWGFYRRQGRLPDSAQQMQALARVGSRWVVLCQQQRTIAFLRPDVELNLGGIGKGYALDRCAELLLEAGVKDFLLHGGQSSVLARGTRSGCDTSRPGWTVGVRHPLRPRHRIAEVRLERRALGTSGTGTQFFHYQGKRYGHILDPRTGWPADGVLSSTAIAAQAASADALATAFYVMGLDQTRQFCNDHPHIGAILVCRREPGRDVEVHGINVPEDQWRCLQPQP